MRDHHSDFVQFLERQVHKYRGILEEMFGPCDQRFIFGSIKKVSEKGDPPHTHFPGKFHFNGGCVVDIHISEWPWKNCSYDQGACQVAHESVHLLDPGSSDPDLDAPVTVLEEGVAAWFQEEPKFHIDVVKQYIGRGIDCPEPYAGAKELVCCCMPDLPSAVKKIRSLNVRIREITAARLGPYLPNTDKETVERLCTKFGGA